MVKTAFILLRSPQELQPAGLISSMVGREEASAILFEDAVYNAIRSETAKELDDVTRDVLVISDDLDARGFGEADLKVGRVVGYDEVVDEIMERTERTVTL